MLMTKLWPSFRLCVLQGSQGGGGAKADVPASAAHCRLDSRWPFETSPICVWLHSCFLCSSVCTV